MTSVLIVYVRFLIPKSLNLAYKQLIFWKMFLVPVPKSRKLAKTAYIWKNIPNNSQNTRISYKLKSVKS
jgi:hypothetical protein